MSIVRLPEYEAEFEPEVFEIYALPRSDANGASPYLDKYHRTAGVYRCYPRYSNWRA